MKKIFNLFIFLKISKILSIVPGTIKDEYPKLGKYDTVLDANWRWLHYPNKYENCFDGDFKCGNDCDTCVLEGINQDKYENTYGIVSKDSKLSLQFITNSNVGSRLYLLENNKYWFPNLLNKELVITIDLSKIPCSLNSAVYLVQMNSTNLDSLGVGYGDAQCPTDIKYFYNGKANINKQPICSTEIDIIEANREAMAWTLHPCNSKGCDKSGADANSYRQGYKDFFGLNKIIDTNFPITIITQFIGDPLREVKRYYKQNNIIREHPGGSLTSETIKKWKELQKEPNDFEKYGGFLSLTTSIKKGMSLIVSLWDDQATQMKWLDSGDRGPCQSNNNIRNTDPNAIVYFSDIILQDLTYYETNTNSTDSLLHSSDTSTSIPIESSNFCCVYSADKINACETCENQNKIVKDSWCGISQSNCNQCNGFWCNL